MKLFSLQLVKLWSECDGGTLVELKMRQIGFWPRGIVIISQAQIWLLSQEFAVLCFCRDEPGLDGCDQSVLRLLAKPDLHHIVPSLCVCQVLDHLTGWFKRSSGQRRVVYPFHLFLLHILLSTCLYPYLSHAVDTFLGCFLSLGWRKSRLLMTHLHTIEAEVQMDSDIEKYSEHVLSFINSSAEKKNTFLFLTYRRRHGDTKLL